MQDNDPNPTGHGALSDEFASSQDQASLQPASGEDLRAVIDVGTNSVKLLVAKIASQEVKPISEESKQTRLGSGFYTTHRLQAEPIRATAEAVALFAAKARRFGCSSIRLIGTSAARDAINGNELIEAIRNKANLVMEVIAGEMEADMAFRGVVTDSRLARLALLILDAGGGSTEFIVGENSTPTFRHSYLLGTVRTLESLKLNDPPGVEAMEQCRSGLHSFISGTISPSVKPALQACSQKPQLAGTGGTATILARMAGKMEDFNRERIETLKIPLSEIRAMSLHLWQTPLARRQQIIGLPPKRADVILAGSLIYQSIMEEFGFSQLRVSTRGLRYSAMLE